MKKKKKSKKNKFNKKDYLISLVLFFLAVILAFFFTLTNYNTSSDSSTFTTGYSIIENSKLEYNSDSNKITDINGLNFSFDTGNILINNKRSLNLVVKEKDNKYSLNKQEFNNKKINSGYKFSSEEEIDNILIKENIIFNEDIPVKIVHSLKNKKDSTLEEITYYYTFDLFEEDDLIVNGSSCDYKGNCTYIGKDRRNRVNFNGEYDFVFDDLIANNFTLSDIKFEDNKLWLGFSIELSLESGEEIELDPTFATNAVDTLSIAPLGTDKVIVVWEDATDRDATYRIYFTNGTAFSSEIDMNATIRWNLYANHGVSASAFNGTHFVACFYNHQAGDFTFHTRDINGVTISQGYMNVSAWDGEAACSVSALNSTHFVIAYINGGQDDIESRVYSASGISASGVMDVDGGAGSGNIGTVSVSAFNSTNFVVGWFDNQSDDTKARIFSTTGTGGSEITVDGWSGYYSRTAQVTALNSTHFAMVWDDNSATVTRVYDVNGNANNPGAIDLDSSNGNTDYTSIATLNSTHYMVAWLDDADDDASIKGITSSGVNFTGAIIDVTTDAQYDVALGGEDVATGVQICNDKFVMAWRDNSSSARWGAFFANGTTWGGKCVAEGPKITIIYPVGGNNYPPGMLLLNISATSDNSSIRGCNYSINGGGINYTLSNVSNYWYTYMYFSVGSNTVTFFCADNHSINTNAAVTFTTSLDPIDVDPDGWSYDEADIAPLGDDKFVLVYSKGTAAYWYYLYFDIYYTNGTQFGDTVYIGYFAYESPHVQAFNSTHFVIGWGTSNGGTGYAWNGDALFSIYNTNFQVISNWTLIEDGTWAEVDVAVLNSTHFVAAYNTLGYGGRSHFKVYDSEGSLITGDTIIEYNIGEDSSYDMVSVAALNSSHFVQCYYDYWNSAYNRLYCEVWSIKGVQLGTTVQPDSDVHNNSMAMDVAAINSTHYFVSWFDYPRRDNTLGVYDLFGVENVLWDSDDSVGGSSWDKSSTVTMLNSTHLVSAWTNPNNEFNTSFRVYDVNSIANTGIINASINIQGNPSNDHVAGLSPIGSQIYVNGLGFCNDNFIIAWNETSNANGLVWRGFTPSGEFWDGSCNDIVIDIVSPLNTTYSSISLPFNISVFSRDYSISKCIYAVDGGLNYSMSNTSFSWYASRGIEFGPHTVTFYCNNTQGTWGSASVAFSMDTGNSSCTWWYNTHWTFRKPITIDKDRVNGSQVNYPLFLNLSDSDLQTYSKTNGDDILFTDAGGCNKLDHEIEYFNKANGWLVAWIRIPVLSNTSDTVINMYYSNNLSGNQQNETRVWDSNYMGVWHLVEDPSTAGDSQIKDSTINRNNGTDFGSMTSGDRVFGRAAYALDFDGSNDAIQILESSSLDLTNFTLEAWVYGTDNENWNSIAGKGAVESGINFVWQIGRRNAYMQDGYSSSQYANSSTPKYVNNNWYYTVGLADTSISKLKLFQNGSEHAFHTQTWGGNPDNNDDPMTIGAVACWPSENFTGIIDEFRISNVPRSAGWINTTYMNMAFPDLFFSIGDEKTYSCNYLGVGNWDINCTDNCTLSTNVTLIGGNINITGFGSVVVSANISNYTNLSIRGISSTSTCRVTCISGGCFKN